MAIMSYDEWKRRTAVALKPRSKQLKFLDACIKAYDKNRGDRSHFDAIVFAFQGWSESKANVEASERNNRGAVTDLFAQILEFRDAHMPHRHLGGAVLRPDALMREIRSGAKLLGEGRLKPTIKVNIPRGETDPANANVTYEEFEGDKLNRAIKAMSQTQECSRRAMAAMTQLRTNADEQKRFRYWFGALNQQSYNHVSGGLQQLHQALQSSGLTFVLREDIVNHYVNNEDPLGDMIEGKSTENVYGYVWGHQAGSGYRVVLCNQFLQDPTPLEAAQTMYHELTHKVLKTKDHGYGRDKSHGFATHDQEKALTNADNWGYYVVSFKLNNHGHL